MIPLFQPYVATGTEDKIREILYSGRLTYGTIGREFEVELSNFFECKNLMTVSNFTTALQIIFTNLNIKYGDEVIASPIGCLRSVMPVKTFGANISWCDIDPETGTMSPEFLKKIISPKTKLIIHTHHLGYLGYFKEINEIASKYNIPVINDMLDGIGAKVFGKYATLLGAYATIFSMDAIRIPNAIEGAGIIFSDDHSYKKCLRIRDMGIDRNTFRDKRGEIAETFVLNELGFSATLNEINSCIGLNQLPVFDTLIQKRKDNYEKMESFIKNYNLYPLKILENTTPNYWVFGCLTSSKKETDEYINFFREKDIYASRVHINNNRYSILGITDVLCGTKKFYETFFALPCGWWV